MGDNSKKSQGIIKSKFQKVSKNFKRRIEIQPGSVFTCESRRGFYVCMNYFSDMMAMISASVRAIPRMPILAIFRMHASGVSAQMPSVTRRAAF